MRLLNTWTLEVTEFQDRDKPPYAILSHRWGEEEVLLRDIEKQKAKHLKGYSKILGCCEQAKHDGFEYVWIDTCCIDKTSSTELAEAINSMFTWYRESITCYAYLEDVDADAVRLDPEEIGKSKWFFRGWTLQELIAPGIVVFFSSNWEEIGTRDGLVREISKTTGIDQQFFQHGNLSMYSVAQRMSWAAGRETTRIEDEAYCLLGLFGVTMPLLYGEGKMAFIRLQEEIMKRSDDQSIFAWSTNHSASSGLLAPSTICFEGAHEVVRGGDLTEHKSPFFTTNKGIQITLPIMSSEIPLSSFEPVDSVSAGPRIIVTPPDTLIALLNCQTSNGKRIALAIDKPSGSEQFRRVNSDTGTLQLSAQDSRKSAEMQTILIKAHDVFDETALWDRMRSTFFNIQAVSVSKMGFTVIEKFGPINARRTGMVSASMSNGSRAGVIFGKGKIAIGIFLAETLKQSCWQVKCGSIESVKDQAHKFRFKPDDDLYSWPKLMSRCAKEEESFINKYVTSTKYMYQVLMTTRRRAHGYFSTIEVETAPAPVDSLKSLSRASEFRAGSAIGLKQAKTMQENTSSLVPTQRASSTRETFSRETLSQTLERLSEWRSELEGVWKPL